MKVILVTHPSRVAHVQKLQEHLSVMTTIVDTVSAYSGHLTALRIAAQYDERVAIMEDDAIPVAGFDGLSDIWAAAHPNDLISFYLGTSRPPQYQGAVDRRTSSAKQFGDTAIWMPTLMHAVCYSVPAGRVGDMVQRMMNSSTSPADFAIGSAWGRDVLYPLESLVQHRDETPVERHPDREQRSQPRVARCLAGPLMFN